MNSVNSFVLPEVKFKLKKVIFVETFLNNETSFRGSFCGGFYTEGEPYGFIRLKINTFRLITNIGCLKKHFP